MRRYNQGLTLIEVAVIVGIIAILAVGFTVTAGYIEASKVGAAQQLVDSLESASRKWAERRTNRTGFRDPGGIPVSVTELENENLISEASNPWGALNVAVAPTPGDDEWVRITVETPSPESRDDLYNALSRAGGMSNVTTTGNSVVVTTR